MELVLAFVVLLLAAGAQAVTSFGYVMLSVPVLALLFDPHTAVVAAVMSSGLTTLFGWRRERAHVDGRSVRWLTLGGILGIPVGLLIFTRVDANLLLLAIGVITLVMTVLILARTRLPGGVPAELTAGLISGALVTTTGTNGPPIVLALQAQHLPPPVFRATIQAIFTLQGVVAVTGLAITGKITVLALTLVALSVPAGLIGWRLGDRIFHRLTPERVRLVVLAALLVSGTTLVIAALS
ncbi:MAG: sulfite exporter TauE/SafE family protein [Ornithinimicrobium sp.]|uniref:sulfite exporter TauE/SafE family protein n=1 Tax=Ornithinimicrobium sp. TaxID=1977084 RepID=UPI0026DF1ACF|nr:sulfite exporter TauE/SafE family protein [Ornithinimicrobium sp.]MDO5741037.1 sulfite exporter TauE/SafE family protein [Ornithinimicrobium sp.]